MKMYQNGDRCPCCGRVIRDKDELWLELFSSTMYFMGFGGDDVPESGTEKEETEND